MTNANTRTIESRDGHYRAEVEPRDDGIHFRLMRHAGGIDCRAEAMRVFWKVIERGVFKDMPFHWVCDEIERRVWSMTDDRPRSFPVRR